MRKLAKTQLKNIDNWIQINARPYDKAKWNYLINRGSKENIVSEMLKYQNSDGGFGNGYEPDILLPLSASIPTAESIFQVYDFELDCTAKWFSKMLGYFENSIQDIPKYWEDTPKEAMDYPHSPWWNYQLCTVFNPNPCAVVASALILYGTDSQKELGLKVAKDCFKFLVSNNFCGDHDSFNIMKLIEKLCSIKSPLVTDDIISSMKRRITENVCYDRNKWNEYNPQPLDFADSPSSMWFNEVKDGIKNNLDFWLDSINDEGVWEPNFSWGIESDVSRQVTKNWKGYIAVRRARIFMNYDVIDYSK
jgi:hypothetical protein